MHHYAHSLPGRPQEEWQLLDDHLAAVADLAEKFSTAFALGWGRLAGLWHDAGKYQSAFQSYIASDPDAHVKGKVDHATVGALIAKARQASPLTFVIAGHHGGLPDAEDLRDRLGRKQSLLEGSRAGGLLRWIEEAPVPPPPSWLRTSDPLLFSLWTRFLFSALVDADFLDTEKFYERGEERESITPSLHDLKARLDTFLNSKTQS
ncbi:MAG TPA: CRISPR-associated endonuclease Cas3'', partial [Bryobacteraceae bacterium]|nr:CRISPR-associated endonuclease Cas3'' [Bryobacteraceae bacterium]